MDSILGKTLIFTPKNNKTNFSIPFTLEHSYDRLNISCRYSPKIVDDLELAKHEIEIGLQKYVPVDQLDSYGNWEDYLPLLNFVTLSLDYEDQYLGCAHRHDPEQEHTISENIASPGFFKHKPVPGNWKAVLNIHAIVSPEVKYHLQITGVEAGEKDHDSV